MSDENQVSEATAPEAAPQTEAQGPDLTVQDLQNLKSIIDVASQRGAFKPNEMMTVGQTYAKLEAFLDAVAKAQPQQGA
jgi:translation initiation factor IF-2